MGQKNAVQDDFYIFPVGEVYYVKFRDPVTRELLTKRSTGYRNKTSAKQWAGEEWKRRCTLSGLDDMPLEDYAKDFFTGEANDPYQIRIQAANRRIGIKTRRDYRSDLIRYILKDPICKKSIALITRADSINFRDRVIAKYGFTRKSKRIFQPYKNIMHTALEKGLTAVDSVIRVDVSYKKKTTEAASVTNLIKLLKPRYWDKPRLRLAALTAGLIGLRAGEIRAIKWKDFNPKTNTVFIVRNFVDAEGEKKPKWEKTRTSTYPETLKTLLEPLRGDPEDRVFAVTGKSAVSYKVLRRAFDNAVKKAKIKPRITLHGLRHSVNTALISRGVNPKLLQATFGWVDESTQEIYTHKNLFDLTPQREATDDLFNALIPEKGEAHGKTRNNKKCI